MVKLDAQDVIDEQVELLTEKIEELDARLKKYDTLKEQRDRLTAARRALLGTGSRLTGNAGQRVTVDDISQYLRENPGSAPVQIAEHFGVAQATIASHLYRNKGRFVKVDGGYQVVGVGEND